MRFLSRCWKGFWLFRSVANDTYNFLAVLMIAISFGAAYAIVQLTGATGEGLMELIGGPVAIACDVAYRASSPRGHWCHPAGGGHVAQLPVWLLGGAWIVFGILYTFTGLRHEDFPKDLSAGLVGSIILGILGVPLIGLGIYWRHHPLPSSLSAEDASGKQETSLTAFRNREDWECSRCGRRNPGRVRICKSCRLET